MAAFIGTSLMLLRPQMQFYGGLSGLACGSFIYLAISGLDDKKPYRWFYTAILIIIPTKIVLETCRGQSVLFYPNPPSFVIMPLSHIVGGLVAISLFLVIRGLEDYRVLKGPGEA